MKPRWLLCVGVILGLAVAGYCFLKDTPGAYREVALVFGEPWADMQKRSSATIPDPIPGHHWYIQPEEISTLRFADPQFEFTTPPAKFFVITHDDKEKVYSIRMSPVLEPLPLEQALQVVLDLQDQWRKKGWELTYPDEFPAYENTPFWIDQFSRCAGDSVYWQAKREYQIMISLYCFADDNAPGQPRYMIIMSMGTPWLKPWEDD